MDFLCAYLSFIHFFIVVLSEEILRSAQCLLSALDYQILSPLDITPNESYAWYAEQIDEVIQPDYADVDIVFELSVGECG